jgi:L-asparaginase
VFAAKAAASASPSPADDAPAPTPPGRRRSRTPTTTTLAPRRRPPTRVVETGDAAHAPTPSPSPSASTLAADTPFSHQQQQLPRILIVHTGGTLGMDAGAAFEPASSHSSATASTTTPASAASPPTLRRGAAASHYSPALRPGTMLSGLLTAVPELAELCRPTLYVAFNTDSSAIGPEEWIALARILHERRAQFDGFLIVHGTDTLAYSATALSLLLQNFGKPVVLTGSQLPLASPRTDARQNLIDSVTCLASGVAGGLLKEVAICFGGKLLRGNRATKAHSAHYAAFESPSHPPLAVLGVDVEWDRSALLVPQGSYAPRFRLEPRVVRMPVVPGLDPHVAFGSGSEVAARGVRGVVLEAFGVGNIPDREEQGWTRFLRELSDAGVLVCLSSQCSRGPLRPDAYAAGVTALALERVCTGPPSAEAAVVKTMLCCAHPDLPLGVPLAGEV